MTDRDAFDDFADTFGGDLDRVAAEPVGRRGLWRRAAARAGGTRGRPVRARRVVLAGGGLALAGTAAALVVGIGGGARLDVVSEARAALAPGPFIVHVRAVTPFYGPSGRVMRSGVQETWSTRDPNRWRTVTGWPEGSKQRAFEAAHLGQGMKLDPQQEMAWAGGVYRSYIRSHNRVNVTYGYKPNGSMSRVPTVAGMRGGDPLATVRRMLAKGTLSDKGPAVVDGHHVRRLVGEYVASSKLRPWPVEYDVDAATYAPVLVRLTIRMGPPGTKTDNSHLMRAEIPVVTHIQTYERLPLTPDNAKLLAIQPDPGFTTKTWKWLPRTMPFPCSTSAARVTAKLPRC